LFMEEGGHPSAMFTPLTSVLFPAVAEYSEIFAFVTVYSCGVNCGPSTGNAERKPGPS
jgi:hypothetical protein